VKKMITVATAMMVCFASFAAIAEHAYISFDANENMTISGPFSVTIPKPPGASTGGPQNSTPSFLDEKLQVSKAGYFADDQLVIVQVETTDAPAGTLTNENLPVHILGGQEFRARTLCIDISQEELDSDDDSLFEFIEKQNVQLVPAVQAIQLVAITEDGTGEGSILYMRNVAGGCAAVTSEFEEEFHGAFERFIGSIQAAD
jgi:hypothetical protein